MVHGLEDQLRFEIRRRTVEAYRHDPTTPLMNLAIVHFNCRWLVLMLLLTASLLLLPLVLPPLPPPPVELLLIPVAILAVLVFVAFAVPPNVPDVAF